MAVPSGAYALRLHVRLDNRPGALGRLTTLLGELGANIVAIGGFSVTGPTVDEEIVVHGVDEAHLDRIRRALFQLEGAILLGEEDLAFARRRGGLVEVVARVPIVDREDLALVCGTGAERAARRLVAEPGAAAELTLRGTTAALVSDGSGVVAPGPATPGPALPLVEGLAALATTLGDCGFVPLVVDTGGTEGLAALVRSLAPTFGVVSLAAVHPGRAFDVLAAVEAVRPPALAVVDERRHGLAAAVFAAITNGLLVAGTPRRGASLVVCGPAAAAAGVVGLAVRAGMQPVAVVDAHGPVHSGRKDLDAAGRWVAERTQPPPFGPDDQAAFAALLADTDAVVIDDPTGRGVLEAAAASAAVPQGVIVATYPDAARDVAVWRAAGALAASTAPDQSNHVHAGLVLPGLVNGLLRAGAAGCPDDVLLAASDACAALVEDRSALRLVPRLFDERVAPAVADAVRQAVRS